MSRGGQNNGHVLIARIGLALAGALSASEVDCPAGHAARRWLNGHNP
jgi:hypothetical protein